MLADGFSRIRNPLFLNHLDSRVKVHKEAVNFCQDLLDRKSADWVPVLRDSVSEPIRNVDMVITIGADGTILHASHFVDDTIPLLGVNSDPTKDDEVEKFNNSFDASRSTGYLCAATVSNFEQVLADILEGRQEPHELARVGVRVNNQILSKCGLNDILTSHPCPASVSRFSFKIRTFSTAAGSTAAMLSAGGYQIRALYIDGSHVKHSVRHRDTIEISCKAPPSKSVLAPTLTSKSTFVDIKIQLIFW
ncbi:hypothetical protein MKX01_041383 [Papaver californicum]|nr:hypothetical protein MKX01_041383 [Papaver californicum]